MSNTYKKGAISLAEIQYIRDNMEHETVMTLAEKLNRSESFVEKALLRISSKKKTKEVVDAEALEERELIAKLMGKPIWKDIAQKYTAEELPIVKSHWVKFFKQFKEDVTYAEEIQIFNVIDLMIIVARNMKETASALEHIQRKEELLLRQYRKPFTDQDQSLISQLEQDLTLAKSAQTERGKERNDALDRQGKLLQSLKSTREQRYANIEQGKKTFFDLMKEMSDIKKRQAESREIELYRLATDKERKRLSEYHQYDNDEVDRPLLNSDTVMLDDDNDK